MDLPLAPAWWRVDLTSRKVNELGRWLDGLLDACTARVIATPSSRLFLGCGLLSGPCTFQTAVRVLCS